MKKIHLYILSLCPFCVAAKNMLDEKGWEYSETIVDNSPELWQEMMEKSKGGNTAPQIFFGEQPIGGFSEMSALNDRGELDTLYQRL